MMRDMSTQARGAAVALAIAALTGCSATPFTFAWEYSSDEPQFALLERCMGDDLAVAQQTGMAEKSTVVTGRRAEAMRKLVQIVDAGDTPTERQYRLAGC